MINRLLDHRYRIEEEIGQGGMGTVYRAHDTVLDRAVAVKVLTHIALGQEGRVRLLREAQAIAKLNHPNIVSVYDAGEQDGTPFLVEELVEGKSLQAQPPQTLEAMVSAARQVCAALEHAHSHGIIHRDLKPENVIMTAQGTAKLMDFGLARSATARVSTEGNITGTVFYLAPEQALGKPVDARSDLYALGVMLYELTTGRLPFTADDPLAIISQHLYAPVVPPRTHRADLPPALEAIILRLLAKNPDERYASAREVADALGESLVAGPAVPPLPTGATDTVALLQQLATGRLIGRQNELNQLRGLWVHVLQGHGHLALISGEPGVGKTRLANEMIVYAQLGGATVLRGGCYEYEATTPYLPLVEALREWVRAIDVDELRECLGPIAPEIAKLAPEIETKLGALTPNPPLAPNEERLRLFDNVARLMQKLAGQTGLLFFIDDLHWADQGTLSLLRYLLRHLRNDRVMFLTAYREVELDRTHPLAAALVEWNRERLATRLPLGRLSLEDTRALMAALFGQASISPEFAQALYRETEGNPFFIEEVIKSLIEQGQIYREGNTWQRKEISALSIPQSVKEAIGRRLNRLSAPCTEALHTAAALGKIFAFRELAAASGASEDQVLNAVDEASSAQLLRSEINDSFAFTHDKIREVLYEELNPIRRHRLHQRIGEALETLYAADVDAHVQDLAHHFTESGDLARGLRYSLLAGQNAARLFALDDAMHYYEHALESAEALNAPDQLAAIYEAMGGLYSLRGIVQPAVENYERAIELTPLRDKRGALKAVIGQVYTDVGDVRGLEYSQAALEELDPATQTSQIALATAMVGRHYHYRALHLRAIEHLERARQLVEPLDDESTLAAIYSYLAGGWQHLGRFYESMEWARRTVALGERKNYELAQAYGYEFLAEDSMAIGNWNDTITFAARDRQIGEKLGALARIAWAEYCHSWALHGMGDLAPSAEAALTSLQLAERVGDRRLFCMVQCLLGIVQADLGQADEALTNAELAMAHSEELQHIVIQTLTRSGLGYVYLHRGEPSRALELLDRAFALIAPTENRWVRLTSGANRAEAYLGTGRLGEAAEIITENLALAQDSRSRHWEGLALHVQGQILAAQNKSAEAERTFEQAVSILQELGSRLELGRALYHLGNLQSERNDSGAAHSHWTRALALFDECGAQPDASRVREKLEKIAIR